MYRVSQEEWGEGQQRSKHGPRVKPAPPWSWTRASCMLHVCWPQSERGLGWTGKVVLPQDHPATWSLGSQQSHSLSISVLLHSGSSHPQLCECQTSRRAKHPKQAGICSGKPSQLPFSKTWWPDPAHIPWLFLDHQDYQDHQRVLDVVPRKWEESQEQQLKNGRSITAVPVWFCWGHLPGPVTARGSGFQELCCCQVQHTDGVGGSSYVV